MSRLTKWLILSFIIYNAFVYLSTKNSIPKTALSMLKEVGCENYEVLGMELPFEYLYKSEIKSLVFLTNINNDEILKVGVTVTDPSTPFLKGYNNLSIKISGREMTRSSKHCEGNKFNYNFQLTI